MRQIKPKKPAIFNQINIAVRAYGRKAMADDLDKPYSTLSNELEERDWAKMGLRDALSIWDLCLQPDAPEQAQIAAEKALDLIDEGFGRIAYTIPETNHGMTQTMHLMAEMSKQFAENLDALAEAIRDGQWSTKEANDCLKENRDLIRVCLQVEGFLHRLMDI